MKDSELSQMIEKLKSWAANKDQLHKLWIFGSRAVGTAMPDSDLDIAFKIFPIEDSERNIEFREKIVPVWEKEIQSFSTWRVSLQPWAGDGTNVAKYVSETGSLIYTSCRTRACSGSG